MLKKYNKTSIAAAVTAVVTILEWSTAVEVPSIVLGAIITLVVFAIPNVDA